MGTNLQLYFKDSKQLLSSPDLYKNNTAATDCSDLIFGDAEPNILKKPFCKNSV